MDRSRPQGASLDLIRVQTLPRSFQHAPKSGKHCGSSGIVVDNVGGGAQESSLYYTYLSNSTNTNNATCNGTTGVGCAVKVTQSGLN